MLTRKHLEALAVAFGDVERATGADAHAVAQVVMDSLIRTGVVTPRFDRSRFAQAVEDGRPVQFHVA